MQYLDSGDETRPGSLTRPMALERLCGALAGARCVRDEERTREIAIELLACLDGQRLDLADTSARYVSDVRVWDALEAIAAAFNGYTGITVVRLPDDAECWAALHAGIVEGLDRLPSLARLDVPGAWEGMDLSPLRTLRKLTLSTPPMFPIRRILVPTGVQIEVTAGGYSRTMVEFVGGSGTCASALLPVAARLYDCPPVRAAATA